MSNARDGLQKWFGFTDFRPGQEEVIEHLLAGKSAAAVFPTGSGKSICYQLPSLLLPGLTVVVSPLIALMKDQLDRLKSLGIAAERLDSTLDAHQINSVMVAMRLGKLRMIYVAPERFNNERFRQGLLQVPIALFAIDEAHCISEWGHNFRPDYLKLAQFARECHAERVLALTATAPSTVLEDICHRFNISKECAVRTGFYRPNLTLLTTPVARFARDKLLLDLLNERSRGSTIVYVTLQRTAEDVAARLRQQGLEARSYHAGMKDEERADTQNWFINSQDGIVVATIAFGMGIDKSNIRYVYHYNLPKSLENYSQEIGRAGRDGLPGLCELLVCADDLNVLENFIYGDTPSLTSVEGLLNELFQADEVFEVSQYELSNRHDMRPLVLKTLLTYLELDGYLQEGTAFYSQYQFQPLIPFPEILAKFAGERQGFLTKVFDQARKAKIWFHVDLEEVAVAADSPRDRVVRALDYLAEKNLILVKVEGVRNPFRRLKTPQNLKALTADVHARFLTRELREIGRLHQVQGLVVHDGCQVSHLGRHFADPLEHNCGHCSWCIRGEKPTVFPQRQDNSYNTGKWNDAVLFRQGMLDLFADERAFAKFLCGIGSPKLSRRKLTSHPIFGAFAEHSFAEVLARLERLA